MGGVDFSVRADKRVWPPLSQLEEERSQRRHRYFVDSLDSMIGRESVSCRYIEAKAAELGSIKEALKFIERKRERVEDPWALCALPTFAQPSLKLTMMHVYITMLTSSCTVQACHIVHFNTPNTVETIVTSILRDLVLHDVASLLSYSGGAGGKVGHAHCCHGSGHSSTQQMWFALRLMACVLFARVSSLATRLPLRLWHGEPCSRGAKYHPIWGRSTACMVQTDHCEPQFVIVTFVPVTWSLAP